MASLRIVVDGVEQRFPLEAAAVTLGRGLESDIRLKDIKASRRHCQIVKTAKGYQCVDLSSGNGTYVNGIQIKQQMLDPGDRITIGSTTILFDDPAPAAKPAPVRAPATPRAPTEKMPLAAPVARPAAAGVASEKVPVVPTRKSTARVDAVKSASQGGLKPVSQAVDPAPPRPLAKTASRVGKPVRAAGTRSTRLPAEPAKPTRKMSPLLLGAVAGGVLLLGGGAFFIFGSHDGDDKTRIQIDQLVKKAEKAEKAERYDEAIQDYSKALELCQGDRHKMRASDIKKLRDALESRRTAVSGTSAPPPKDPHAEKGPDFQAKKSEIAEKRKIAGEPATADWTGALKDWGDFLKAKVSDETKSKVEGETGALQAKAKEDADRLRKKAEALAQENKMAEAVDLLRQQLPRFQHPSLRDLAEELQSTLKKYDK